MGFVIARGGNSDLDPSTAGFSEQETRQGEENRASLTQSYLRRAVTAAESQGQGCCCCLWSPRGEGWQSSVLGNQQSFGSRQSCVTAVGGNVAASALVQGSSVIFGYFLRFFFPNHQLPLTQIIQSLLNKVQKEGEGDGDVI